MLSKLFSFSSPLFALIAFHAIFIYGELTFRYFEGTLNYYDYGYPITILTLIISASILFLYVTIFSLNAKNEGDARKLNQSDFFISSRKIYACLYLSILTLVSLGVYVSGNPISNPLGFRQAIQSGGAAYFLYCFLFFLKLFGIYYFDRMQWRILTFGDHFALFISVIFSLASGFASLFVYVFIAGMLYTSAYYNKKIMGPSVFLLASALVILTPLYTLIRELRISGLDVDLETLLEYQEKFSGDFLLVIYNRFDYFDNLISGYWTALEHPRIESLAGIFAQPIPRAIWPDKPYNFSTEMTLLVYPENVIAGVTANFGFIAEFIYYFGSTGIPLAGIFFMIILLFSYRSFIKSQRSKYDAAFYVLVVWTYFTAFIIGYINDAATPTLIINIMLWMFIRKISPHST